MGFGEPWRVIHSLPCTNSPVIHPQAPRPPLPVCLPHSARLTFLQPKCIYISPPSSGSTLPHTWYHVQKEGVAWRVVRVGERAEVRHPQRATSLQSKHPPQWWKCRSVTLPHPGSPACLKKTTLSWGIDLLTRARCHAQLVNIRGKIVTLNPSNFFPV